MVGIIINLDYLCGERERLIEDLMKSIGRVSCLATEPTCVANSPSHIWNLTPTTKQKQVENHWKIPEKQNDDPMVITSPGPTHSSPLHDSSNSHPTAIINQPLTFHDILTVHNKFKFSNAPFPFILFPPR